MSIIVVTLVVFAIVLTLTKAKVLAWKREFVEQRYAAAKVGGQDPGWLHRIWHGWWNCPMCCGFWVSLVVCWFCPVYGWFWDVLIVFGLNWLFHCLENVLFNLGKFLEKSLDNENK